LTVSCEKNGDKSLKKGTLTLWDLSVFVYINARNREREREREREYHFSRNCQILNALFYLFRVFFCNKDRKNTAHSDLFTRYGGESMAASTCRRAGR